MTYLFLALCWLWSQIAAFSQEPGSAQWREAIDRFRIQLRKDVDADDVGGITAAVFVGNRMVWAEGFGWADRDQKIPAGVETIYRVGSISKPIAAVALVQLAQAGKLNVDDPVAKWVPEVNQFRDCPEDAAPMTLRHLVTHSAGLVREPALLGHSIGPVGDWESKVLASIPTARYARPPGEQVEYSNIGFATLGLAIGRASETPFIELVERDVFHRLQLRYTSYRIAPEHQHWLAVGYSNSRRTGEDDWRIDSVTPAREHNGRGYRVPNGGVYSTVGELGQFMAAMWGEYGDVLLSDEWRREMMRLQTPGSETSGYGLGFNVQIRPNGHCQVGHGGSVAGYTAHMVFDPDARVGVILLRNYNQGATNLSRAAQALLSEIVNAIP
ncbi:MAG TPA: serine hydrolase domain-containing protein [Pirellulaceae bacterium]|nr:serine hydrolase domain-containing protein [Pirellulaceae bacterium]